ncbi:MAG: energy-coupling factor ABC transporter permease [Deltaproteobacteria bacterium]|nr:energy-coupling factor ABC transporter permease [Deltaproteobacteria bacterium]
MHMADALLSPAVGATMWAVSGAAIACCSGKVQAELDDRKIPLMGVLGAFIFAAQMINFTIPLTGSSGHLGGGLMLSILLGPHAAFLTIASVLVVQALFFADGGLLALGCNIFNLGFFPAFIAYPLIYKKIVGKNPDYAKISVASLAAAVIALQLGAFGVVLETVCSGISALPFYTFAAIMQPIHLAIGIVEGLVTAAVITFICRARPEILQSTVTDRSIGSHAIRNIALAFLAVAVLMGGMLSWFASERPDGLEWSITRVTGQKELKVPEDWIHGTIATMQKKLSFLPDYSFKIPAEAKPAEANASNAVSQEQKPEVGKADRSKLGASVSGLVGGALTLTISFLIGFILKRRAQTV